MKSVTSLIGMNVFTQILLQVTATELPTFPWGDTLSVGAIVSTAMWYLWDENKQLKKKSEEKDEKHDLEIKALNDKYEALAEKCREREIGLWEKNTKPNKPD